MSDAAEPAEPADPIARFAELFAAAAKAHPRDPNYMVVSSVSTDGRPSSRVVLLKDFDARGFVFYTNLQSQKGRELLGQKWAALLFYWQVLDKQVRIEGRVEAVGDAEADAYFATRARGSQLGAWASDQSRPLEARGTLERRLAELEKEYEGRPVPRPPHWSGLRIVPDRIEFWTNKPSRLHDRVDYRFDGSRWSWQLLNP